MQLKSTHGSVHLGLMAATCALFAAQSPPSKAAEPGEWQVDTGLLYYKENNDRIETVEPVVNLQKDYGDERQLNMTLTFDSLTGGSPNGAIPSRQPQTFATPSGTSLQPVQGVPQTITTASGRVVAALEKITLYDVPAGALPLDPNFKDQRGALDLAWTQPWGESNHLSVGGHASIEHDFDSIGTNAALSHDFNDKLTTVSIGATAEYDRVKPIGGAPVAGSDYTQLLKGGSEHKQLFGGQFGISQVLARRWVAQLNYTYERSNGYLTDPYKIVSLVDALGDVQQYRFESRPDSRVRQALYLGNKIAVGRAVLDLSYRYAKDDWDIKSHTADLRLHLPLSDNLYLEPHLRNYRQTAAKFYDLYLDSGAPVPVDLSADPRLAEFRAHTYGIKLGYSYARNAEFSLRIEQYAQTPALKSSTLLNLQGLDLNPDLKSIVLQVGWRFAY
ncbi:MAG: DUF3570 domain-containing protein [Steroidobacteraceae bacterium]